MSWALRCSLLAACVACQPVAGPPTWSAQQVDAKVSGDTIPVALSTELTGTWALATDWATCVKIGKEWDNRTRKLLRVVLSQQGHRVVEKRQVCSIMTTPLLGLTTTFPPGVIKGIGPLHVESLLFWNGVGQSYLGGVDAQLFGVQLDDPIADALPGKSDLDDPRIIDSDGDGKPGATLKVGGACEVQVVQRALSALDGVVEAPGRIVGQGMHATQQVVLSASMPICGTAYTTRPNDAENHFVLVRVDAGGLNLDANKDGHVSCPEIVAAQEQFITWNEPNNTVCNDSNDPPG